MSLYDVDYLTNIEPDVPSELFEELPPVQGFGNGAKGTHFPHADVPGAASPPFIVADELGDFTLCPDLNLEDMKKLLSDDPTLEQIFQSEDIFYKSVVEDGDYSPYDAISSHGQLGIPDSFASPESEGDMSEEFSIVHKASSTPNCLSPTNDEQDIFMETEESSRLSPEIEEETPSCQSENQLEIQFIGVTEVPVSSAGFGSPAFIITDDELVEQTPRIISVPVSEAVPIIPYIKTIGRPKNEVSNKSALNKVHVSDFLTLKEVAVKPDKSVTLKDILGGNPVQGDRIIQKMSFKEEEIADNLFLIDESVDCSETGEQPSICLNVTHESEDDSHFLDDDCIDIEFSEDQPSTSSKKKRSGPYSLNERKLRKKEQNKRAALRYRQKKKDEEGSVLSALQAEEKKHKELLHQYDDLYRELKVIKKLVREAVGNSKLKKS